MKTDTRDFLIKAARLSPEMTVDFMSWAGKYQEAGTVLFELIEKHEESIKKLGDLRE